MTIFDSDVTALYKGSLYCTISLLKIIFFIKLYSFKLRLVVNDAAVTGIFSIPLVGSIYEKTLLARLLFN